MSNVSRFSMTKKAWDDYRDNTVWVLASEHDAEVESLKRQIAELELSKHKGWPWRLALGISIGWLISMALKAIGVLQ